MAKRPTITHAQPPLAERIAYYSVLAIVFVVPTIVAKVPFVDAPALAYYPCTYEKLAAFGLLMLVALTAWAVGVMTGRIEVRSVPLGWAALALGALSIVSTGLGLDPRGSLFGTQTNTAGLPVLLAGLALYALTVQVISRVERTRGLSWAVFAGGALVGVVGVMQALGVDPLRFDVKYYYSGLRIGSLLGNSDYVGSYLVVPLIVAAALALSEKHVLRQVVAFLGFLIMLVCLFLTGTRGAWIGAFVGLVVFGISSYREARDHLGRRLDVALLATGGVSLIWFAMNFKNVAVRFADLTQGSVSAGGGRLIMWSDALRVIASRPFFGTGPDAYVLAWYGVRSPSWIRVVESNTVVTDPHNVFLLVAATLGVPAVLVLIWMVGRALWVARERAFVDDLSEGQRLYAGWWAAVLALGITLLFTVNSVTMVVMLFLSLGVLSAAGARPVELRRGIALGASVLAVAIGLFVAIVGVGYAAADVMMARSHNAADRIGALDEAARVAPWYGEPRRVAAGVAAASALSALQSGSPGAIAAAQAAEERLAQVVATDPWNLFARINQAGFLVDAGAYLGPEMTTRGLEAARSALRLNPGNPLASNTAATALAMLGDFEGAIAVLEPLWDADPYNPENGLLYARCLDAGGQTEKARAAIAKLKERFPSDARIADVERTLGQQGVTP